MFPTRSEALKMRQSRRLFWSRLRYWVPTFLLCQALTWSFIAYDSRPRTLPPTPRLAQLPIFYGQQVRGEPSNLRALVFAKGKSRMELNCDLQGLLHAIECLSPADSDRISGQDLRIRYWKPLGRYPPVVMDVVSTDGRYHVTTYAQQARYVDGTRRSLLRGFDLSEQVLATFIGLMLVLPISSWCGTAIARWTNRIRKPVD